MDNYQQNNKNNQSKQNCHDLDVYDNQNVMTVYKIWGPKLRAVAYNYLQDKDKAKVLVDSVFIGVGKDRKLLGTEKGFSQMIEEIKRKCTKGHLKNKL